MSKRLMIVLALAFVVGITCASYAEVQNVKVGGDITILAFDRYQFNLCDNVKDEAQGLAEIANVKVNADLTDAVSVSIILRNERIWGKTSTSNSGAGDDDGVGVATSHTHAISGQNADLNTYLAAAYVTMKEFAGQPLTLKLGQMAVKLGNGMIVGDPNTNGVSSGPFSYELADYCPRKAFTGGLAIWDMQPAVLTFGALKVAETSLHTSRDDVNALIANAGFDITEMAGLKKGLVEVYDVYKDAEKAGVNNIGVRLDITPMDNLGIGAEYAYQIDKSVERDDFKSADNSALMANVSLGFPDVAMAPVLGADYARFSDNWNPMFEDLTPADIANVLFSNTNVQLIGFSAGLKPMEDLGLKLRFANFQLVEELVADDYDLNDWSTSYEMTDDSDLGNEFDATMTYDYTSDVQFGLKFGYFMPGDAFADDNNEDASQLIGSMKVTF